MDDQKINKVRKRVLVVAGVIVALFLASFFPMPTVMQVVLRCIVILVCLTVMVYLLKTTCASSVREKGDYFCFISPLMFFVVVLNTASFLPLSEDIVAILRLCAALIAIIGSIVILAFSKRN